MIDRFFRWWAAQFHEKDWTQCVEEWHTWWCGFGIGFTFQSYGYPLTNEASKELEGEEHYFHIGRCVGRAALIVIIVLLIRWLW